MKRIVITLLTVAIVSCQSDEFLDSKTEVIFKKVDIESLNHITQTFVPLAEIAWKLSDSEDLKQLVYSKVEDQFDGDFNVLFKDILEPINNGRSDYTEYAKDIQAGIEIYQTMSHNEVIHPQIFIPFYDELNAKNLIGIQKPVIVFRDGPPTDGSLYDGYEYFDNELFLIGKISEQYAMSNEVWVISTNERVNENGEVRETVSGYEESGRLETYGTPKITSVRIKGKSCMKEDWIGGKIDVWIQRRLNDSANPVDGVFLGPWDKDYSAEVKKVERSDAKKSNTVSTSFTVVSNWDTNPDWYNYNRCSFVIFEYDPSPAGIHTVDFGQFALYYKSYEGYYVADEHYIGNTTFSWSGCFESNMY